VQTQPTTSALSQPGGILAGGTRMQQAVAVLTGSILLAVSAHLQLPFWPVPLSMQSFVVLVIGLACGSRLGITTVLAYLVEGMAGLPVFHGGAGFAYLAGPTGGYLIGFLFSVALVGAMAERGLARTWLGATGVLLAGDAVILLAGVGWLSVLFGLPKAVAFGLVPFLPAEAVKLALAVTLTPYLRRR